jgi:hypothetical protein
MIHCRLRFFFELLLTACLLLYFRADSNAGEPELPSRADALTILQNAYSARQAVDQWHCRASSRGYTLVGERRNDYRESWDIWIDGSKILDLPRSEFRFAGEEQSSTWKNRMSDPIALCIGCYTNETASVYKPGVANAALSVFDPPMLHKTFNLVNPRNLGIIPRAYSFLAKGDPASFYRWNEHEVQSLSTENNGELLRIGLLRQFDPSSSIPELEFDVTFKRQYGFMPITFRNTYKDSGTPFLHQTDLEYEKAGDRWLPRHVTYKQERDGAVCQEEEWEIETISCGHRFDPDPFTLSGMGVPAGTLVSWGTSAAPPADGNLVYDGTAIVEATTSGAGNLTMKGGARHMANDSSRSWPRWILALNGIVILGCVVRLLWRRSRRKGNV